MSVTGGVSPNQKNKKPCHEDTKTLRFHKVLLVLSLLSLLWRKIFSDLKDAFFENPLRLCAFVAICCFSFWSMTRRGNLQRNRSEIR
jgi:hypothetical protein